MQLQKSFFTFVILFVSLQLYTPQVSAQPSTPRDSTWITDGPVNAVAYSKGATYIGGDFSYVGPNTGYGAALNTTSGVPDLKFPKVNGAIYAVTADGADGWYIGGSFNKVGQFTRNGIAHIKSDRTVDPTWDPNPAGSLVNNSIPVQVIVVNGSTVFVGGNFTSIGGQQRKGLAALNASTGQATAWNPNASNIVRALAINGATVYVGGDFTSIGGQYRSRLAAINLATGNATSWNPTLNARVNAIVISDTLIFVGGEFTSAGGQARNRLAAFGITSGLLTGWNPNASAAVSALASNGTTLYIGGSFTNIGGLARHYIAALSIYSSIPLSWNPDANGPVRAMHLMSGSLIYVGGGFTRIGGQARPRIAVLEVATGQATAWISNVLDGPIRGLALNTNGSVIYAGGDCRSIGGQWRNRLAALDAATGFATAWNPNVMSGSVHAITVNGPNVYIGGTFTSVGGNARNRIAAINAATGVVTGWNPNANGNVYAITIKNSTVYVGGNFSTIGGQTRNRLAALDIATGLANSWNPNVSVGSIYTILTNGATVYAGGDFYSVGAELRQALAAIDATTGLAAAWNPNLNTFSIVYAMVLDGSTLYIGGDFSTVKGQTRNRLAAVDITTANPTGWNPNANGIVRALALSGANVYAGGAFTTIGIQTRNYLAAIDKATGTPTGWNPNPNSYGSGQGLLAVGSAVLAGGTFTTMGGNLQDYFAQFGNVVVTNTPPNTPTAVVQCQSDEKTVIPEGGVTTEKKVVFKATVADPDDEPVKLQIELRKITEAFTGTPTHESGLVNSGTQVIVIKDALAAAGYKWRYRAMDARGLANAWVEFGAPGNTDFVVDQLPNQPVVTQFKSDGTTAIPEGGTTNENKIVFKATVSDPDSDQVKLQIELRRLNEVFQLVPNLQSNFVKSGTSVTLLRDSLVAANYKWRYRVMDVKGVASDWTAFGTAGNTDFVVAANKLPAVPTALQQLKSDGITAIAEGGTTSENKVIFKATVSDPDNDQVKLQIELRRTSETFTGVPNLQSVLVNSGATVTITRDTLAPRSYKWRAWTMDARGAAGPGVQFGAPGNTDFVVNRPPAALSLNQFKPDGVTAIPEGGAITQKKVVFKGTVSDPDGEQAKLQIELRKTTEAFTGTPNLQSGLVNSGLSVTTAKDSLFTGDYKWRYRVMDARGLPSAWKELGAANNTDFTILSEPPILPGLVGSRASGTEFWMDVWVGEALNPVTNLYGVSFVLNFSPTNYIDVVTPYVDNVIAGGFMGNDVVFYQTVDEASGKINVGVSRKAGQGGVNSSGVVLRIKFFARPDTPDTTKALFAITDVKANDPQGNPITLFPRSKLVTITNMNVIVWPGDTNNDGAVNQADVLPIGLYWGNKGPARPNAAINWSGQPGTAWTPLAATYANANGDTIVNQAEIAAIGLNWGQSHSSPSLLVNHGLEKSQTPASATIMPEIIPAVQPPNQEFFIRIRLAEVTNLFGLSFELAYDKPQLLQVLAVESDSLFGNDVVFYSNVNAVKGTIAVGISRKAGQAGVNGAGAAVRVKAKTAANAAAGAQINFSLRDVLANDARGMAMTLSPQTASLTVGGIATVDSNEEISLPSSYNLLQNRPNPFHVETAISYEIPQAGQVVVQVYNLAGQEVLQLVNSAQQPGRYTINWNGRDNLGRSVPSGVYICRLQAGAFVQTQRMIVVR